MVLKHSAIYPAHEQLVGQLARGMGFTQVGGQGGDVLWEIRWEPLSSCFVVFVVLVFASCPYPSASSLPQVSLSSVVMPMVKMVPRGFTAAADAYLTPHILR